jgi:hypothetical protein
VQLMMQKWVMCMNDIFNTMLGFDDINVSSYSSLLLSCNNCPRGDYCYWLIAYSLKLDVLVLGSHFNFDECLQL